MKIRTNYTFNSNSFLISCFSNEISLRKWSGGSAHLRTFGSAALVGYFFFYYVAIDLKIKNSYLTFGS